MQTFHEIFGLKFYCGDADQLAKKLTEPAMSSLCQLRAIHTVNIDHVASLRTNPLYHAASEAAWVRTIDGWPISVAARLLRGVRIPRITGADFIAKLGPMLDPARHRVAFVVSNSKTQIGLSEYFCRRGFSMDQLYFYCPPFGFESDFHISRRMIDEIVDHRPTHLFMGVGSPKSEVWIHEHAKQIGPMYVGCFGAGLEFLSGARRRAPRLIRVVGLEWGWRLLQDPFRLGKRYARAAFHFIAHLQAI